MKVLILGDDGRAHALAWKLFASPAADLLCGPGNGGTAQLAPQVELALDNAAEVTRWAFDEAIDLIIPAASEPLAAGLVDEIVAVQIGVCGPPQRSTKVATSYCAAKEFLLRHGLPTPNGRAFNDLATAEKYLAAQPMPIALRPDAPAAGALVFHERYAALEGLRTLLSLHPLEGGSSSVVIEAHMPGVLVSFSALTDGTTALPMLPTRIYDQLSDAADSPLAPGMGAHTGSSVYATKLRDYLQQHIIAPLIAAFAKDRLPYWGFIGVDCLIGEQGPRIVGLRCTMRDMEAQVVLPRLEDDLLPLLQATIARRLDQLPPLRWRDEPSVAISLVAHGYPKHYAVGGVIGGLTDLDPGVLIFHHQTHNAAGLRHTPLRSKANPLVGLLMGRSTLEGITTTGGHVCTVVALGATLQGARGRALINADRVTFNGRSYRADIGASEFR